MNLMKLVSIYSLLVYLVPILLILLFSAHSSAVRLCQRASFVIFVKKLQVKNLQMNTTSFPITVIVIECKLLCKCLHLLNPTEMRKKNQRSQFQIKQIFFSSSLFFSFSTTVFFCRFKVCVFYVLNKNKRTWFIRNVTRWWFMSACLSKFDEPS